MFDVATSNGYNKLKMQLKYAEKIGCKNFLIVFMNFYSNIFSFNTDHWKKLCFIWNGKVRNKNNWNDFIRIIEEKAPIPNIEPVIEEEDMRLENVYYQNRPKNLIKIDPKGYGIRFLRACFDLPDSNIFDEILDAKVRQYQIYNNLLVDGKVGPETFGNMIKVDDFYKNYCWTHSLWARGL
jgi:hypothetical protein